MYASLQFDTLRPGVYPKMRGVELIDMKMKAIEVIKELDIPTVIVPTVSKGDNSDELGALVEFGFELEQCSSIVIQPMAHTGDGGDGYHANPAGHRLTMPEVHQLIEEQTGWFKREHFHPVPCSHPSCYTATYLFRMDDGKYIPLPEFVNIRQYLDAMQNRAIIRSDDQLEKMILDSITNLWSATKVGEDSDLILASLKSFLKDTFNSRNPLSAADIERRTEARSKALFIHDFMDPWDLDVARLKKCCTHYVMPDGRLMPGCSYNNLYRHKDERFFPDAEPVSPAPVALPRARDEPTAPNARQASAADRELVSSLCIEVGGPLTRRAYGPAASPPSGARRKSFFPPRPAKRGEGGEGSALKPLFPLAPRSGERVGVRGPGSDERPREIDELRELIVKAAPDRAQAARWFAEVGRSSGMGYSVLVGDRAGCRCRGRRSYGSRHAPDVGARAGGRRHAEPPRRHNRAPAPTGRRWDDVASLVRQPATGSGLRTRSERASSRACATEGGAATNGSRAARRAPLLARRLGARVRDVSVVADPAGAPR